VFTGSTLFSFSKAFIAKFGLSPRPLAFVNEHQVSSDLSFNLSTHIKGMNIQADKAVQASGSVPWLGSLLLL
jgi:hypothetical protein